jgi:hypothetical protein
MAVVQIEFVGERERQASFPDVLCVFRRVELDLHYLIVDTNKWAVNRNRQKGAWMACPAMTLAG